MNKNVIVIGAGVWGLSTAFHLAKEGIKDILVLEKNYIASLQSGHTSGIVRQLYSNITTAKMARLSLEYFKNFKNNVGESLYFNEVGLLAISFEKDQLLDTVKKLESLGIKYEMFDSNSIKKLDRNLKIRDDEIAVFEPEAGYLDPIEVTWAFAKSARNKNVQINEGEKVLSISKKEGKWIVRTTSKEYVANKLIVTAGTETPKLIKDFVDLPVYIIPYPLCYFKRPREFDSLKYIFADFSLNFYVKPEDMNQFVMGALHSQMSYAGTEGFVPDEFFHWSKVDTEIYRRPDYETLKAYIEGLQSRFENLKEIKIVRDLMPYVDITPDWEPIIDEIDEGLFVACGSSGHGFKLAPIIGKVISELIIYGEAKTMNIEPYLLKRFKHK